MNVYVDGTDVRERGGIDAMLEGSEEIRLVAAIAGGSEDVEKRDRVDAEERAD